MRRLRVNLALTLLASGLANPAYAQTTKPVGTPPGAPNKATAPAGPTKNEPPKKLPGSGEDPPSTMEAIQEAVETPYRPKRGGHRVKFNLKDADLEELVNHISGLTGRRFIYGAKVRQIKVTVVSPSSVTLNEAYEAFLSILHANGMTVVPHGRFMKIVDSGGIVSKTTPVYSRGTPVPNTDRIITRLYRLKHATTAEVTKVLTRFKSKEGDISSYEAGQLLIITDTGSHIRRLIRIIEELDVGGAQSRMWIEPVHYGSAVDLAKRINEIYDLGKGKGGSDGGLTRVIADEQTNSLIIIGLEEGYDRLLELLRRVDIAPAAEGRIHVLPLQHADADELAKTLTRMLGGARTTAKKGAAAAQVTQMFDGEVRVTGDKSTNSLVVSSSGRDFAQLRLVVEQLDQKRRQVFLEAVIMDASIDNSKSLGLSYHAGQQTDLGGDGDSVALGGFNAGNSVSPASLLQGLALGVRGPNLPDTLNLIPGIGASIPAFGVVLNAMATNGDSNVLSTPHIIALDNTEAEINIGENVPLQTNVGGGLANLAGAAGAAGAGGLGALGGLGGLAGGFGFNAQRTDVGTKIKITPHINQDNQVRLEIEEEISERGAAAGSLGAVSITQRQAKTTVVVDDQQTVVIGGLMRETKENTAEKIPILGDLPVLGFLFRSSEEQIRKTNLLLILTPHVIRNQADLKKVFHRKMQERQEFLDRHLVFTSDWKPPRDFSRSNGLVENIRQSFFEVEEAQRREAELAPREEKIHTRSEPLDLASGLKRQAVPRKTTPRKTTPRKTTTTGSRKRSSVAPLELRPMARSTQVSSTLNFEHSE